MLHRNWGWTGLPIDTGDAQLEVIDLEADNLEVREFVSFLDGSIQIPEIRHHLWRSWGFCPRHTWLHAVAECELRGGRPFVTTILYRDLTTRAVAALSSWHFRERARRRLLRSRDTCFTCDYLALRADEDPLFESRTKRVNQRKRVTQLVVASRSQWHFRSCPACLGGSGPLCRPHLLAGVECSLDEVADDLNELSQRLTNLYRSMTWKGPIAVPADSSSWIEALGWFAGWAYPAALDTDPSRAN
jgi:hypothetical protein